MSLPVEVDRACPKNIAAAAEILHITTSGSVRHLGIFGRRKRRVRLAYTPVKNLPQGQNICITTEIASISVSVNKLLAYPVWVLFLLPVCI